MSERTISGKRFGMLFISVFTVLLCLSLAGPVRAQAAGYKMVYEKPVKVGAYYYRVISRELDNYNFVYVYQRSSEKETDYEDLFAGTDKLSLSGSFATDGQKIYYGQRKGEKTALMCGTIPAKETKAIKSYKSAYSAVALEGVYGNNLYAIQREGKNSGIALIRVNMATGKIKNLYKNFAVWNAMDEFLGGNTRYLAVSLNNKILGQTDGSELSRLVVLDKKTGKAKTISKSSVLANTNVSGADPSFYKKMTKKVIYSEYNASNKTWYIKQYTFSNKKAVTLKVLNNIQKINSIIYEGTGAAIYYDSNEKEGEELKVRYK